MMKSIYARDLENELKEAWEAYKKDESEEAFKHVGEIEDLKAFKEDLLLLESIENNQQRLRIFIYIINDDSYRQYFYPDFQIQKEELEAEIKFETGKDVEITFEDYIENLRCELEWCNDLFREIF